MRAGFARRHARACCPQTTTRGVFGRSSARTAGRAASPRTLSAAGFSREGRFRGDSACLPMASRPTHPGGRDPMKRSRMPPDAPRAVPAPCRQGPRPQTAMAPNPQRIAPKPVDCPGEGARCRAAVGEGLERPDARPRPGRTEGRWRRARDGDSRSHSNLADRHRCGARDRLDPPANRLDRPTVVGRLIHRLGAWPICRRVRESVPRRLEFLGHAAAMAVIVPLLSLFFAAIRHAAHRVVAEFPRDADSMKGPGEATRPD